MKLTDKTRIDWLIDNCAYLKPEAEDAAALPDWVCYAPGGPHGTYVEVGRGDDWRECVDAALRRPQPLGGGEHEEIMREIGH